MSAMMRQSVRQSAPAIVALARFTALVLIALSVALASACSDATAPADPVPSCASVLTVHGAYGDLYVDPSAIHDGVLSCRLSSS